MVPPDVPWRQQWQYVGTRKIPEPRLSCAVAWTDQQTLYHGRNPGTSRHCLPLGLASLGTINDLPLSVKNLAIYVMTQTPAKQYNFLDTPCLIMVQANGYRPEPLSPSTTKHAEGMGGHTDGASVDQNMPKIHVYVKMDGTLVIILKTNKDDVHQIIGKQGSTMLLPGGEGYIKHGRATAMTPGSDEFTITLVIRLMHLQKGTNAVPAVMSGSTCLTTPNRASDWGGLAAPKILTCRTIMGEVIKDRSTWLILEQNPGLLISATYDSRHSSPGGIATSSAGPGVLSIEPSVLMGSVKGSIAAGGAVAIYLNHDYVTILQRDTSAYGTVKLSNRNSLPWRCPRPQQTAFLQLELLGVELRSTAGCSSGGRALAGRMLSISIETPGSKNHQLTGARISPLGGQRGQHWDIYTPGP